MNKETETIDNFDGFETNSEDFFGEADIADPLEKEQEIAKEEEEKKKKEEDDSKDKKSPKTPEKKETKDNKKKDEEEVDFFPEEEEEGEEEKDSEKKKEGSTKSGSESATTLNYLKKKGFLDLQDEEGNDIDITDENSEDLLEDAWEFSVEKGIKESMQELPEEVKNLIRFTSKGGDPKQYLKNLSTTLSSGVNKDSDISMEETQKASVEQDLKLQGYDDEYIKTHIKVLKDSGKLKEIGEKSYDKIISKQKEQSDLELKAIEDSNKDKKAQARKFKKDLNDFLNDTKEINTLKIAPIDKKELPKYISEPAVELQDGRKISQLQADLFKTMGDKGKLVLLSKVLRDDFNFSFIEKKALSKDAKKKRRNLRNEEPPRKGRSLGSKTKKPIWEMID